MGTSRRRFLKAALAGGAVGSTGLVWPRNLGAATVKSERKFVFVYCAGGWDTTYLFTPAFDLEGVDAPDDSETVEVGELQYVQSDSRDQVDEFLATWGDQTAFINGMEIRSVTHERCEKIMLTGAAGAVADDWAAIIAGNSQNRLVLPHLVVQGPGFTSRYTSGSVRVGSRGQLSQLMDGSLLAASDIDLGAYDVSVEALTDAYIQDRADAVLRAADRGRATRVAGAHSQVLTDLAELAETDLDFQATSDDGLPDLGLQMSLAFDAMEMGLSRSVMIRYDGQFAAGWDTHGGNEKQGDHFDFLARGLSEGLATLDGRVSPSGADLADEVVVVVVSEMGRHPQLAGGGKGHWTYTSAMLIGSGVRTGVYGAMDADFVGAPLDLASGEVHSSGVYLDSGHLGATLLALADVDPGPFLPKGQGPIAALLR